MLASAASTACRALLAQGMPAAAAAGLLPAATPALYTAVTKLSAHLGASQTALFTSSGMPAFAAKPAAPSMVQAQEAPTGEEEPRQPAVAMHPGMLQGGTGGIPAAAASATGGQDQALASTTTPTSGAAIGGKFSDSYMLMHPVYSREYVESIVPGHRPPKKVHEWAGYYGVQALRRLFDLGTGYGSDMTERKWLARFLYLETVAGVPGMVSGMLRHMRSLRSMRRDNGWIHTLLEEAENERMHLLTFMQLRQPGIAFRGAVLAGQGIFFNLYLVMYTFFPKTCHSFVGYLEEEAVKTYTRAIEDLDAGRLPQWTNLPAPEIGLSYWRLPEGSSMRDLLLAVRADEACHSHVNHTFAHLDKDAPNPFAPGSVHVA